MKVEIVERVPVPIACLRYVGSYGPAIGRFWIEKYAPWAAARGFGVEHARYGIGHDDPSVTRPDRCRYDACAEITPELAADIAAGIVPIGGAFLTTLPGGCHATIPFRGTAAQIGAAWHALLDIWLPASGFRHGPGSAFEYYPRDAFLDQATGEFACELWVPLA
jgi:AraC family transcriptional regulator